MKIENDELWNKIKEGELKGLSIEGYFTNKFEEMNKKQPTTEQILSAFNELVREGKITTMSKANRIELGLTDDVEKLTKEGYEIMYDSCTTSGLMYMIPAKKPPKEDINQSNQVAIEVLEKEEVIQGLEEENKSLKTESRTQKSQITRLKNKIKKLESKND